MNYKLYRAEDFASDESFIAYVLKTDEKAILFWKDWIIHHPEKLDEVYNAERLLAKLTFRLEEQELQDEFSKFDDFLNEQPTPVVAFEPLPKNRFIFKRWTIAAVLCLVFSLGGYYAYEKSNQEPTYITYRNGDGKISKFVLSDGSQITLSSNSTLRYPKEFIGDKREVALDGEGFFEITKDKTKPFTVLANGIKTTVLGTKFNVMSYKNRSVIQIALIEGKVEVQTASGRDKLLLNPSEMATFDKEKSNLVRTTFSEKNVTAWRSGMVIFDRASFKDVAEKLKNIYGIELINRTNLTNWSYSGEFEKTDYLTIIKSICFAKKINYKQTNQTFILTK